MKRRMTSPVLSVAVSALSALVLSACMTSPEASNESYALGLSQGCETGSEEAFRETSGGTFQTPLIDIARYHADETYRDAWDVGFVRCFRRAPGMSSVGAVKGETGSLRLLPVAYARYWVDQYIEQASAEQ